MQPATTFGPLHAAARRAALLAAVRAEPSPSRAAWRWRAAFVWGSGLLLPVVILLAIGGPFIAPRAPGLVWATAFGALAAAIVGLQTIVSRQGSMLGPEAERLVLRGLAITTGLFLWKLGWSAALAEPISDATSPLACASSLLAFAIGPLAATLFTRRGTAPVQPGLTGLALGLAAGAWAWGFGDLACADADPLHLALGHLAPMLLIGLVGLALGRSVLAPGVRRV